MANWKGFFDSLFGLGKAVFGIEQAAVSAPGSRAALQRARQRPRAAQPRNLGSRVLYQPGDGIGGKYDIRGKLGEGGFGLVYLAYRRDWHMDVALKTFRHEFLADGATRAAYKKEALLWLGLDKHPFILVADWVEEFSGRLFVQMDYVAPDAKGRVTLQDHLLRAQGPLPVEQTLRWAVQFCQGMEHASACGIRSHRDIKPSNILITQDGTPKISDFGLAAAAETAWGAGRSLVSGARAGRPGYSLLATAGRRVCGTPGYIAPEIYEQQGSDVRSDIYSFGIVLWQMAQGSPLSPFHSDVAYRGDDEAFAAEYQERVYQRQHSDRWPMVGGPLQGVLGRCLAYERSRRFRDFRELRVELEGLYRRVTGRLLPPVRLPKKTAGFCNNKGNSLYSLGRYEEALSCYDQALQIDPRYSWAWSGKGNSLNSLGRYEEALRCYDQALQTDPHNEYACNGKGNALGSLGRDEQALRCYDQALQIKPRYPYAWHNKGNSLRKLGRYQEALRCYDQALQADPNYAGAWNGRGNSLYSLGRYEEALRCYDQALQIDPRNADAWFNKAETQNALGKRGEAGRCFRKVLELAPPQEANLIAEARKRLQELA